MPLLYLRRGVPCTPSRRIRHLRANERKFRHATECCVYLWERGKATLTFPSWPKIIESLGYFIPVRYRSRTRPSVTSSLGPPAGPSRSPQTSRVNSSRMATLDEIPALSLIADIFPIIV